MNKELESLKRIRQETCAATYMPDFDKNECCDIIEQALLKGERDRVKADACDIIIKKNVDISLLKANSSVEEYNNEIIRIYGYTFSAGRLLTKEEFETVKEVTNEARNISNAR